MARKTEATEQIAVVKYCYFRRFLFFHCPNEQKRDPRQGNFLKQMGMRAGVPDLIFPESRHEYIGLAIEMKFNGGRTTPDQEKWLRELEDRGWSCWVCDGYQEAMHVLDWYYDNKSKPGPNENRYLKRKAG